MDTDLLKYLANIEPAFRTCHTAALCLLGALGTTAAIFAFVRSALMGSTQSAVEWFVRLFLAALLLSAFVPIFDALVTASNEMTKYFLGLADWSLIDSAFNDIFLKMDNAKTGTDLGQAFWQYMKGGFYEIILSISWFLIVTSFQDVFTMAGVMMAVLKVIGPFMIVGGVIGNGSSLKTWFGTVVQVMIWPIFPPLLLFLVMSTTGEAIRSGNTSFILSNNLILAVMAFFTPLWVAFIVGKGGITAFASGVMLFAAKKGGEAASWAFPHFANALSTSPQSMFAGAGAARPDDLPQTSMTKWSGHSSTNASRDDGITDAEFYDVHPERLQGSDSRLLKGNSNE
jgi:hypothetical protein